MSMSYEDLMNSAWGEIPDAVALPAGQYRLRGRNATFKEGQGDKSSYFMFVYQPQEALEDVDVDALAELGPNYDMTNNRIFFRIWIETNADIKAAQRHLEKHGIDLDDGTPIKESLKAFKGSEVIAELSVRIFKDNSGEERQENDAKSFAPVE